MDTFFSGSIELPSGDQQKIFIGQMNRKIYYHASGRLLGYKTWASLFKRPVLFNPIIALRINHDEKGEALEHGLSQNRLSRGF